ncbi:capsular polysaccharide biosynthesis protein [Pantoea sp. A4]|uniref:capsular polysaccharide biosynthesis protein n=1 Tax=Pantoea sp. A4 TaxID=1225184 RepID=UPI000371442A|nr:capsular polysaccharide biosynthesis protein [Pantoea sp. A4]
MIGVFSSGIWRIPHLENFLGQKSQKLALRQTITDEITQIAVWGYRPSTTVPCELAAAAGKSVLRLEDGFIRSLGLGATGSPPLSMVLDKKGIYYDASQPSTLEYLIKDEQSTPSLAAQAKEAMQIIVAEDLAKYNQAPAFSGATDAEIVLVVDQTAGDMSVVRGNAGPEAFTAMLDAAVAENPKAEIWLKVHPDVLSGKKAGYFGPQHQQGRVKLFTADVSPQSLLRHVSRVYAVTSQYGFEALVAGKPVVCFGQPWYAGWGLTDDRHPQAQLLTERRGTASLVALFAAAYLRYSRYIDPVTGEACDLFRVMQWLSLQKNHTAQRTGELWAPGLSLWKASVLKPFLRTNSNRLNFSLKSRNATACVVWGTRGEARWSALAQQKGLPVWRMEDGFLRSSGLGSDLLPPLSLVLDKQGIYYDATRSSDLESLLKHSRLTQPYKRRAINIQQQLVEKKLSKYNLGAAFSLPEAAKNRRVLLVPGQVEDDASIQTGTISIRDNLTLLRTVRQRNPDAFIIYKPHPDVLVGNRKGHIPAEEIARLADLQATDADVIQCIQLADELHTMTSLSGFEALLHGRKVYCYGMPFYAGWGLTVDEHRCERRDVTLSMEDLVYQVLIQYPTYLNPLSGQPIAVEDAITLLHAAPRRPMFIEKNKCSRVLRYSRKLMMFLKVRFG